MLKQFRTWHAERAAAATLAVGLALAFGGDGPAPWLVALARVVGFWPISIADRIAETAELRMRWADKAGVPDNSHQVECASQMNAALVAGFLAWGIAQAAMGAWDGLIWAAVVAGYRPVWRRLYRRWRPIQVADVVGLWSATVVDDLRGRLAASEQRVERATAAEEALLDVREALDKARIPADESEPDRVRHALAVAASLGIALKAADARVEDLDHLVATQQRALDEARSSTRAITMQDVSDAMWGPRVNAAARATGDDWDLSPQTMQAMADALNSRAGLVADDGPVTEPSPPPLVPRPCLHANSERSFPSGWLRCLDCGEMRAPVVPGAGIVWEDGDTCNAEGPLTERRPRVGSADPDDADEGRGGSPHSARENAEHYARLGDRYAGPCDCGGRGVGLHGFHYPGGDGCLARRPRAGSVAEQGGAA